MSQSSGLDLSGEGNRKCVVFCLIAVLLFIVYANTINDEFHFDDTPNIVRAKNVHIKYPTLDELKKSTIKHESGNLYRPVARVSLALNWFFGGKDVTGYHLVNIAVHILACFFLYLAIMLILRAPRAPDIPAEYVQFVALLAAVLWAANPIQTQAVTYIVQRMASMAAMFYIMGLYFYMKGRLSSSKGSAFAFYGATFLAYLLAVGSKENAVMFPFALVLLEVCFFADINKITNKRFILNTLFVILGTTALGLILFAVFRDNPWQYFTGLAGQYEDRPFTLGERLLTQPRVLIFYLSQIFYPIADRLSLVHDFRVSSSLFSPWTTLPSILAVLGMIVFSTVYINRFKLLAFPLLFFFLNHAIESSIFPLEMVFEHRNYLPSMFLFLPVAAAFALGIEYFRSLGKKTTPAFLVFFATLLVFLFGSGTYVRNMAWADDETLWRDAIQKAPRRARPYNNLALIEMKKDLAKSRVLLLKTEKGVPARKNQNKKLAYTNLANVHMKKGEYKKAIEYYEKLLKYDPDSEKAWIGLIGCYLQLGDLSNALKRADIVLQNNPKHTKALGLKSFILLKMDEPEKAYPVVQKYLGQVPDEKKALLNMGCALIGLGKYRQAGIYLKRAVDLYPGSLPARLLQLQKSLLAGENAEAEKRAELLLAKFPLARIGGYFSDQEKKGNMAWPVDKNLLLPFLQERLQEKGKILLSGTD